MLAPRIGALTRLSPPAQDVEPGTDPAKISSVFCSQAVVLAIRECVRDTPALGPLVDELKKINSRLCSPRDLHRCFAAHASEIPNAELDASCDETLGDA